MTAPAQHRAARLVGALLLATTGVVAAASRAPATAGDPDVPAVLSGDRWLAHHRDELMPYWTVPDALGDPLGNFPSARDADGHVYPGTGPITNRQASTLGRGVYGYSLAFMLTGDEKYLTYARAGLDWIEAKLEDPVNGGYFGTLKSNGVPGTPKANKDLFDLASVGLGYAMYYNATRDPEAEAKLLHIRDLVFGPYYDPTTNRLQDTMTFDLSAGRDTFQNGGDLSDYVQPGTSFLLPVIGLLSSPERNDQFRADLRYVTDALVRLHKNTDDPNPDNRWMFWGRTGKFGVFDAAQTGFGDTMKSYSMILNANQLFADRPWSYLADDRTRMLGLAWDDASSRWNQRPLDFSGGVEPNSGWWTQDEGDELLATLDLTGGFTHVDQLSRSAQTFLDIYVDHASPVKETWARVPFVDPGDERKSFPGKNMLHNMEHALILYLHGRALEGRPARLYYAFPHDSALTAEARPYWFDATGQERNVVGPLAALPGHDLVTVDFTGIGALPRPPYPPPADSTPPTTTVSADPAPNAAGWNRSDVTLTFTATDDGVGVKEIRVRAEQPADDGPRTAFIRPGDHASLVLTGEGEHVVTYHAVDALGNAETDQVARVRIDRTAPVVSGLPGPGCVVWPPNHRMVPIADVTATDDRSGVADLVVTASPGDGDPSDVRVDGGRVWARAELGARGRDRVYTVTATATDAAGNTTTADETCTVTPPLDD